MCGPCGSWRENSRWLILFRRQQPLSPLIHAAERSSKINAREAGPGLRLFPIGAHIGALAAALATAHAGLKRFHPNVPGIHVDVQHCFVVAVEAGHVEGPDRRSGAYS
jgi:hypothetical protein